MMDINQKKTIIFAHRGASAYAPENTLQAFRLAVSQGADAFELDTKLSADRIPVVIHDFTVDRTTNGTGFVSKMTLAQLKELDAGTTFDKVFVNERIPTLEEVLDEFGGKVLINIELTNYKSLFDSLPNKVAELIDRMNIPHSNLIISSFNPIALIKFHRLLPDIFIGLLVSPGKSVYWATTPLYALVPKNAIHPEQSSVTRRYIERIHKMNLKVYAYTVNDENRMADFFSWGVDGIFTDNPLKALQILENTED